MRGRLLLIRATVLVTLVLGVNYVVWRWLFSVRWSVWWIAVPLVIAETYSLIDSLLFGLRCGGSARGQRHLRRRKARPSTSLLPPTTSPSTS